MTAVYDSPEGQRAVEERYRTFLGYWPGPNEQLRVPTRQGETFVVACGPSDTGAVVLLHGSAGNAAMWMGDVAAWSATRRVYAVDVIGEPGLSAPARPPLASARYAEWLDDVLDAVNVERAAFVAVSLGGWLALDYAIRRPARVERLALLAPGGVGRQRVEILLVARLLMALGGKRGRRAALRLALGPMPVPSTPSAQAFAAFVDLIWRHFRPRTERLPRFGGEQLDRLDLPLLAILGANDGLLDSRDTSRRLRRHCPSAHIVLLQDTGHLLLDQTQRIQDFLHGAP